MSEQTYAVERDDDAVNRVLNKADAKIETGGTHYRGMSYEQGIKDSICWLVGDYDEEPLGECPEAEEN